MTPKELTLVYLVKKDSICLALKKRGFGAGNWNGYGGKIEEGETVEMAAVREVREESGVEVEEHDLEKVALVDFFFKDRKHLLVHTYFVQKWEGEPVETEEMYPRWYAFDAIPYDLMWADDIHWLPQALLGEKLRGKVWFADDGMNLEKMEWDLLEKKMAS